MGYRKDDVQTHWDGYGRAGRRPAVNVKHWPDVDRDVDWRYFTEEGGPSFREWVLALVEDDAPILTTAWEVACENAWENVQNDAELAFEHTAPGGNHYVKVHSEGRSGGWAVVDGLKDFDAWDAIDLAAWRRFEKWAQAEAKGVAYGMVDFLLYNVWDGIRYAESADGMHATTVAAGVGVHHDG